MTRIKSVAIKKPDIKWPGAREHHVHVMEDGEAWGLAVFRLHHFEANDVMVFHRVDK
jgi:hypothetical protein